MDLAGKVAVVTGASEGIGRAVAISMAKHGANVVLAARNTQALAEACEEIEKAGHRAIGLRCDVTKDAEVTKLAQTTLEKFGKVDILVNNAGVGVRGRFENLTLPDWEFIIQTNLLGYIRNVKAFLPHFLAQKSGYVVNVSSVQGLDIIHDTLNIAYITTKCAILGFSECLYAYLRPQGINVSCLCPGGTSTNMGVNTRFVGNPTEAQAMRERDEKLFKLPFMMKPEVLAESLIEGMREEKYLILFPGEMAKQFEMNLREQGKDIQQLNTYLEKNVKKG
jgi:NAD(P)-dependent dehydrogenase (short-subunit alcohol dehydrogenase family)